MLGIAHEGMAIPLFWQLLPKAGNASAQEHIGLLQQFITLFGGENIQGVLGDREFASSDLFAGCNQQINPFLYPYKKRF